MLWHSKEKSSFRVMWTDDKLKNREETAMIFFDEELQQITLTTQHNQLTLGILPSQHLVQLYFGKKIPHGSLH